MKRRRKIVKGTGKRGCLCEDENKYHPDCCKKNNRWGQGPGKIYKED